MRGQTLLRGAAWGLIICCVVNGPARSEQQPGLNADKIKTIKDAGFDAETMAKLKKIFPELGNAI